MASKAAEKRYAAMQEMSAKVVTFDRETHTNVWHFTTRPVVAEMIRELLPLGRTERWTNAIENWAAMVLDTENNSGPKGFEWAFFQGGIYVGHAAD